jgi:hypothetical protein
LFERAEDRLALSTPSSAGIVDALHGPLYRRAGCVVEARTVHEILSARQHPVKLRSAETAA